MSEGYLNGRINSVTAVVAVLGAIALIVLAILSPSFGFLAWAAVVLAILVATVWLWNAGGRTL
jgi:hypothetical protein